MTWQVGDLAVCVELNPQSIYGLGALRIGAIYTVTAACTYALEGLCLNLAEARSGHPDGSFRAFRFRKILPDKHEQCEPEFVTLLKRIKRKQPA